MRRRALPDCNFPPGVPPWGLRHILGVLFAAAAVGLAWQAAPLKTLARAAFLALGEEGWVGQFLAASLAQAFVLGGGVLGAAWARAAAPGALGLGRPRWQHLAAGLAGGLLVSSLVLLGQELSSLLFPGGAAPQEFVVFLAAARTPACRASLVLLGCLLGPTAEELYFRGMLYPYLRARLGEKGGAVVSSLCFGLLHGDPYRFLPLFLAGLGLAWLARRARSLYPAVLAHVFWNTAMLLALPG